MQVVTKISIGDTQPGEVVELEDGEAKSLIRQGYASPVGSNKSAVNVQPATGNTEAFIHGEVDEQEDKPETPKPRNTKSKKEGE